MIKFSTLFKSPSLQVGALAPVIPIVLGYLPVGFAFGILAGKAGLSPANAMVMSILVYAGSSQLIALGLFAAGASAWTIILTTLVVNLRHLLMSAALSPYLRGWKRSHLAFFGFELTDETFALHSTRFAQGQTGPRDTLWINVIAQVSWVAGSFLGVAAGGLIQDVKPLGLDYALAAMFIALLVMQVQNRRLALVALVAGTLSTVLLAAGMNQWNVIVATVIAATLGMGLETWTKKSS